MRPVITTDPGNTCGVALFLPSDAGSIIRYRLRLFGTLKPNTPKTVHLLFLNLLSLCDGLEPCLYLEDQYIDQPKKGRVVLRGDKLKALVKNAHCWEFMAAISDVPCEMVNPATWQSRVLRIRSSVTPRAVRKQKAQKHIEGIFEVKPTQDEADAICIGIYAMSKETEKAGRICRTDPTDAPAKGTKWRPGGGGLISVQGVDDVKDLRIK